MDESRHSFLNNFARGTALFQHLRILPCIILCDARSQCAHHIYLSLHIEQSCGRSIGSTRCSAVYAHKFKWCNPTEDSWGAGSFRYFKIAGRLYGKEERTIAGSGVSNLRQRGDQQILRYGFDEIFHRICLNDHS